MYIYIYVCNYSWMLGLFHSSLAIKLYIIFYMQLPVQADTEVELSGDLDFRPTSEDASGAVPDQGHKVLSPENGEAYSSFSNKLKKLILKCIYIIYIVMFLKTPKPAMLECQPIQIVLILKPRKRKLNRNLQMGCSPRCPRSRT